MAKADPKAVGSIYHTNKGSKRKPPSTVGRKKLGVKKGYHISKAGYVVRNKGKRVS